jgi:hypothetical protein
MTSIELPAPNVVHLPSNPDVRASRAAWIEHARVVSTIIRAQPLRTVFVDQLGGDLVLVRRAWSAEISRAAGLLVEAGLVPNTVEGWTSALGTPEVVDLSEDGVSFRTDEWCGCGVDDAGVGTDWVFVARWGVPGRTFHGFVCDRVACRRLKQTG